MKTVLRNRLFNGDPRQAIIPCFARVQLGADEAAGATRWHEVAYEGHWDGHWMGTVDLTPQGFDEMLRNGELLGGDIVVDYEHASVFSFDAPAAGWVEALRLGTREDGLMSLEARIRWTDRAAARIRADEYRYMSIVAGEGVDRKTGESVGQVLWSIALTNTPFLDQLPKLALQQHRRPAPDERNTMDETREELERRGLSGRGAVVAFFAAVLTTIGLEESADGAAIQERLRAHERERELLGEVREQLELEPTATASTLRARLFAATTAQGQVAALNTRIAELEQLREGDQVDVAAQLVEQALSAGRIAADDKSRERALSLAKKDPAAFRDFLALSAPVVPQGVPHRGTGEPPVASQSAEVCKQLGIDPEQFAATKQRLGQ